MKYEHRPDKRFGQHFLYSRPVLSRILDFAGLDPDRPVIEVGPGTGYLTRLLLERGCRVVAVELDRSLLPALEEDFGGMTGFNLVAADALHLDYHELARNFDLTPPLDVIGNFPYQAGTPLVRHFIRLPSLVRRVTALLQDEVACRMAAAPGSRNFCFLSLLCQHFARVEAGFTVKPGSFFPPPKVLSRIIRFDLHPSPALPAGLEEAFLALAGAAFAQPRKTLLNNLQHAGYPAALVIPALQRLGLDANIRPGGPGVEQYRKLFLELGNPV